MFKDDHKFSYGWGKNFVVDTKVFAVCHHYDPVCGWPKTFIGYVKNFVVLNVSAQPKDFMFEWFVAILQKIVVQKNIGGWA